MEIEKRTVSRDDLWMDLNNIKTRMHDYDWEYRLTRFEDKIAYDQEILNSVLNQIKLAD